MKFAGLRIAIVAAVCLLAAACSTLGAPHKPGTTTGSPSGAAADVSAPTALILDGSGSMTTADPSGPDGATAPRIEAAIDAAGRLIDSIPSGTQFTLLTYGTNASSAPGNEAAGCQDVTTLVPLGGLDATKAKNAVAGIAPRGYTPISLALQRAADNLPASGPQAIVLVSDGEDTCGKPPCDTASELHRQRPDLTISTIGFRTEGAGENDLSCIANTTNGLFVTADNSAQLASRLRATQDLTSARESLTATGLSGAEIGQQADDIRATHSDLPAVSSTGKVVIVWRDCDLTFVDGVLTGIAPRRGGRTVDGIAVGDPLSKATALYGEPVSVEQKSDGTTLAVLTADETAGTAYRITVDGSGSDAVIKRIVLCRCLSQAGNEQSPQHSADSTALTFGGTATIRAGMSESALASVGITPSTPKAHGCNTYPVPDADYLQVVAANGKVLGIKPVFTPEVNAAVHSAEGVKVGDTAASVRAAYKNNAKLSAKYLGLNSENVILAIDGSGKAIGFAFDGNRDASDAVPDSAVVKSISAGDQDLAQGFEVCSG